jgi:hypothetical protein
MFQAIRLPDKGYARHFQYLKESYLPVPPLEQQKRIVAKIEELFSHIDAGIAASKKPNNYSNNTANQSSKPPSPANSPNNGVKRIKTN